MARHLLNIMNSIPVFGHIKGTIQHIFGDDEAAAQAFVEANRTTAVLAAGATGFYLAGAPLAILCGAIAGAEWDLGSIVPTNGEHIQGICHIIDDPSNLNAWIEATVEVASDGLTGVCGGRMAAAAGKTTSGAPMTQHGGKAAAEKTAVSEESASKTG